MGKLSRFPKIGWVVSRSFSYNKWTCGFCPQTLQFDPPTIRHKRVTYLLIFFLNIFSEEDKSFEDSESIRWLLPPKLRVSLGMIIFHYAYVSTLILFIYMFHQYRTARLLATSKFFPYIFQSEYLTEINARSFALLFSSFPSHSSLFK